MREYYIKSLKDIEGITVVNAPDGTTSSEQYFCVRIDKTKFGECRDDVHARLKDNHIMSRKYFYPLVSDYPCYSALSSAQKKSLPIADLAASEVLCLPFYSGLELNVCELIISLVINR